MKKITFTKMHGLGNDFIVIDATQEPIDLSLSIIKQLSNRRRGIGFDQLLLIEPSRHEGVDYRYRIFNANGQEVEQCGNGARCVARYLFTEKHLTKKKIILDTLAGRLEALNEHDNLITVNMGKPNFVFEEIPFIRESAGSDNEITLPGGEKLTLNVVSMGNPHAVICVPDISQAPVSRIGKLLQIHPAFPKQVNVGFMEIIRHDQIKLRVYERGVDGETEACGSGACAAVAVGKMHNQLSSTVEVILPGGCLSVTWTSPDQPIYLTGPAESVFKGEITMPSIHKIK